MYYLIETEEQLKQLYNQSIKEAFVEVIPYNDLYHPLLNRISLIYVKPKDDKGYLLSIDHNESFSLSLSEVKLYLKSIDKIYVRNKKTFLYYIPIKTSIDLGIDSNISTPAHDYFYRHYTLKDINKLIPLVKHYEKMELVYDYLKNDLDKPINEFYNKYAPLVFLGIEKNGLKINSKVFGSYFDLPHEEYSIKDELIYTQYNLNTLTKRPSNSFNGVNFSALNKENKCRKSFIPRNDYLVEFDLSAYHPAIIANLVGYDFKGQDIHKHFAELYGVSYDESKEITFKQLYGHIFDECKHLEFFDLTQKYITKQWNDFQTEGFIITSSGHKFEKDKLSNMNPNKLFNYILQETETFYNVSILWDIIKVLREKESKIILYVYDSFLIDWNTDEDILDDIKNIFKSKNLQFKMKKGKTYNF